MPEQLSSISVLRSIGQTISSCSTLRWLLKFCGLCLLMLLQVTFKYTITNGLGNATASCTVTNRKQPVPPRTKDDSFIMTVGETRLLRVLDNDQGGGTGMVIADLTKSKLRRARAEAVNCWVGGVRSRSCVNYTAPLSPGEVSCLPPPGAIDTVCFPGAPQPHDVTDDVTFLSM